MAGIQRPSSGSRCRSQLHWAPSKKKRIDGALLPDPLLVEARKRGFQVTYLRHNELTTRWMVNGWAATRTWADANSALVKRFASAMLEANRWGNAHPIDAYPIITKYTKFPETLLRVPLSAFGKPYTDPDGAIDPAVDMNTPPIEQIRG